MLHSNRGDLDVVAKSFNLLNHRNISVTSTAYGSDAVAQHSISHPTDTPTARRIQFSLD